MLVMIPKIGIDVEIFVIEMGVVLTMTDLDVDPPVHIHNL